MCSTRLAIFQYDMTTEWAGLVWTGIGPNRNGGADRLKVQVETRIGQVIHERLRAGQQFRHSCPRYPVNPLLGLTADFR